MSDFKTVEVNLSEEEMQTLCRFYVRQNFDPATISLFEEVEKQEGIERALYRAVLNEVCIIALVAEIEKKQRIKENKEVKHHE